MPGDFGTIGGIARFFVIALRPLREAVGDPDRFRGLVARLGWDVSSMPPAFASLGTAVASADAKLLALPASPSIVDELDLAALVAQAFDSIQNLNTVPPGADASFLPEFRSRLFDLLLMERLAATLPSVFSAFQAIDVVGFDVVDATATRPSFPRLTFDWAGLGAVVREPTGVFKAAFDWGTPAFDHTRVTELLAEYFFSLGFPITIEQTDGAVLRGYLGTSIPPGSIAGSTVTVPFFFFNNVGGKELEASFALRGLPATSGKLPGFVFEPRIPPEFPVRLRLSDTIELRLKAGTNVADLFGITVRPGETSIVFPFAPGKPPPAASLGVGFDFTPKQPTLLLGSAEGTRLEWQGASVDLIANVANGQTDLVVAAALNGLALVISGKGESLFDGFLEKIMGGGDSRVNIPLGIEWGGEHGIRFQGSGGFEVEVHPHLTLGPIRIETVTVRMNALAKGPPDVRLDLAATVAGSLGPLDFFVKGIGLRAEATFAKGNLGPLGLDIGFLAPTGVGLSLDVGGFKGGGFLMVDAAKGEYAGGLELDFQGIVTVKAVGLLNTIFPDGHRGFALVIIISAEFPPIQLGFGFTLVGVGGLLGLSRTVDTDAMRESMHQGSLDSVLFPRDIVKNAPRIVNDLRRLFPPAEDHFLIGPMVKFGWGTPTILSLEFGLILDIPVAGFVMIGRLRVGLPFQDLPLFDIRVTFAGGLDFDKGQLWFDATLHGSRLLAFALTGDMAVRLYWKENANFILTVGGFHPAYTPPPMGLGSLQRLGITIFDGMPRLRAETYFAITSNTVQFGAKAELFFGIDIFNIYGFIAFDVLIQFDPFRFIASLSAMLAVRSGSAVLMGIRIDALVEGPQPWHAKGTGHFEISLIISISFDVDFEVTAGDELHDTLPSVAVLPKLAEAFAEPNNWRAVTPTGTNVQVTLRQFEPAPNVVILHPFGSLELTEKLVPLNLPIQRLGTQRIGDGHTFGVEHVLLGSKPGQIAPLREQFAPAQFIDMNDAEKLSRQSFERYEAGVQVGGGDAVNATYVKHLDLNYEVIYVPEHHDPVFFKLSDDAFSAFAGSGAVSRSTLSKAQTGASILGAPKTAVAVEQFAVASTDDLSLHSARMVFQSEAEARAAMRDAIDRDPTLTSTLQVIPSSLVKAA